MDVRNLHVKRAQPDAVLGIAQRALCRGRICLIAGRPSRLFEDNSM